MACGENPKRVYGRKGSGPSTRMGNIAGYRTAWIKAQDYRDEHAQYAALTREEQKETKRPKRDLELETLAGVLDGEIIIHMHCYRADEMLTILDLAKEFDYKVGTFHHGVEAYKIADELAENDVCGALWADWWGFKMEAYDGIQENITLVDRPDGSLSAPIVSAYTLLVPFWVILNDFIFFKIEPNMNLVVGAMLIAFGLGVLIYKS